MAGRSLFRRLLGNRSDAVVPDDVSASPNPADPVPVPYPNDAEPTAFDEADAVFGKRTEPDTQEAAPPAESTPLVGEADGIRNDFVNMNGIIDGGDRDAVSSVEAGSSPGDGYVGMNGIIGMNGIVDGGGGPSPVSSVEAGSGIRDGIIEMNGIISPNNVVADPDDDLILADLTGGSIRDQLAANAGVTFDTSASGLTDDLDDLGDLDDVDVD